MGIAVNLLPRRNVYDRLGEPVGSLARLGVMCLFRLGQEPRDRRALLVLPGIASRRSIELTAATPVEIPLSSTPGRYHSAFWTMNLHRLSMPLGALLFQPEPAQTPITPTLKRQSPAEDGGAVSLTGPLIAGNRNESY
jgi:hypothetical protein